MKQKALKIVNAMLKNSSFNKNNSKIFMRVIFLIIREMVKVFISGKMVIYIKECGLKGK